MFLFLCMAFVDDKRIICRYLFHSDVYFIVVNKYVFGFCFLILFLATVSKMVRPMLSDGCLSVCPVCLFVTLVYCGQIVGWIRMPLGIEVGLGQATLC